jgi:hypothetical protein
MKKVLFLCLFGSVFNTQARVILSASVAFGLGRATKYKMIDKVIPGRDTKLDNSKNGFEGLGMLHAGVKKNSFVFGAFFGFVFNNSKPETSTRTPIILTVYSTKAKIKAKGPWLILGPEVSWNINKFNIGAGVGFTFSGYKANFEDIVDTSNTADVKTKLLNTFGAMPFVKLGYSLGSINLFSLIGYQFSTKAKLNVIAKNDDILTTILNQTVKKDGLRAKVERIFLGVGATWAFRK